VVSQEVGNIEAGAGDGRALVETSVRSMPVVAVDPGDQLRESLGGVLVEPSIGPFADSGLDKPFGLAVGAWCVDAGANVFDLQLAATFSEAIGAEAGTVISHDAANRDAHVSEVSYRLTQETAGGGAGFIRKHGGESHAGVIVNGDIKELPAGTASFVLRVSGETVAGFVDARQLFDVDMQQVAGGGMLVANDGNGWFERANGVQFQAGQDAADGGPAQASGLRDSHAGPALATQLFDVGGRFGGSATR